ncbi:MAG TPA: hypothetical protein VI168_07945 [Croceibacterium sp.]
MRAVMMKAALLACGAAVVAGSVPSVAQGTPRATAYESVTQWPDFGGVWSPGVGSRSRTTATPPKLTAEGKALVDAFEAGKARGENLQTQAANCVPNGMPGIMRLPYPIEFIYSPGRVNILIETYSEIRRVYVDGRPLPEDPDLFFNGNSVGRWEGDTLVVETVGISPMVSILPGLHATGNTRFVERISRPAPDRLVDEITVTDPALFAEPYVMVQNYTLEPEWEMREYVCQENNRDGADAEGRPSMDLGEDDPFGALED